MTDDRSKILEATIAQIEKQYGKGAIMRLGSSGCAGAGECDPRAGRSSLDAARSGDGQDFRADAWWRSSDRNPAAKTTMTLHVIARGAKDGRPGSLVTPEHALDPAYARKLGVDVDNLLVSQPDNGEHGRSKLQRR